MDLVLYVAEPESVAVIGASPPSWMAEALLVEKELPFRRVALSFAQGEHRTPSMKALNPRTTIPVLTDAGAVVHETLAILLYVESIAPGHLPKDPAARARALTRYFEAEHLKTAGMSALAYLMRTPEAERDRAVLRSHAEALHAELDQWDRALAEGYAAGAALTLADFVVYPYTATLRHLGLSLARWSHVCRHHDTLATSPAFVSTRPRAWGEAATRDPWTST